MWLNVPWMHLHYNNDRVNFRYCFIIIILEFKYQLLNQNILWSEVWFFPDPERTFCEIVLVLMQIDSECLQGKLSLIHIQFLSTSLCLAQNRLQEQKSQLDTDRPFLSSQKQSVGNKTSMHWAFSWLFFHSFQQCLAGLDKRWNGACMPLCNFLTDSSVSI